MGIGFLNCIFGAILLVQYLVSDLDALMNYNRDISVVSWYDCNMDIPSLSPALAVAIAFASLLCFKSCSLTRVAVGLRFLNRIECSPFEGSRLDPKRSTSPFLDRSSKSPTLSFACSRRHSLLADARPPASSIVPIVEDFPRLPSVCCMPSACRPSRPFPRRSQQAFGLALACDFTQNLVQF
jgi:hypothetical protein